MTPGLGFVVVRVAWLSAAMLIAAATEGVGAAANLADAYAQAWFWGAPLSSPPPKPGADKNVRGKTDELSPEWFWSFPTDAAKARRGARHLTSFSGSDLWRHGAFLYGGTLWTPAGSDHDGFVVKLTGTRGYYRYRSGLLGNTTVTGTMYSASIMPGLRFTRGGVSVGIHVGVDYQMHVLSPDDPGNPSRGRRIGLRKAIDLWYQPTDQTMIAGSATLTTISAAYAVRAAFGWRMLDGLYVGPEVMAYGAADYQQLRVGAHITGLEFIWLVWQAGIGYAYDDDGNSGAYLRIGVSDRW